MSNADDAQPKGKQKSASRERRQGLPIFLGLCLGVACGVFFGEYCRPLQSIGDTYVGLLQMTVLPYLVLSLIGKLGRLNITQARRLSFIALTVLVGFWLVAILLILATSSILPPAEGASFYSPRFDQPASNIDSLLETFVPKNVFLSLTREYVPAVVVFCLFFGCALMLVPGKERLIDLLDLCCDGIGQINLFLVKLAPLGLFALSAAAAGTLRIDDIFRIQAYLIVFSVACVAAAFGALPILVSGLTEIRYRELMRAASEPMLTAIATGKLFVVLPQIIEKCDELVAEEAKEFSSSQPSEAEANASVLVPLAYPFPHVGKILAFVFVTFAAWYSGTPLSSGENLAMAATGASSSFASPLISIPFLLDRYELSQDMIGMFILPGFITMRLGDVVGVVHLMALTLIVSQALAGRLRLHWVRLGIATALMTAFFIVLGVSSRLYLASTSVSYDLDKRFLAMDLSSARAEADIVSAEDAANRSQGSQGSTLLRLKRNKVLRVGFHPDHLPYSFMNSRGQLVGFDVELIHRLARRINARIEFVPYEYSTVIEQLKEADFDVVIGGIVMKPERLLDAGFTEPYLDGTIAIVTEDHRRREFRNWNRIANTAGLKIGAVHEDVAAAAREQAPLADVIVVDSIRSFFDGEGPDLDGLIVSAEEGAAWNVLYPSHAVVVPGPVTKRPIGMGVRLDDLEWQNFLNRWLGFEKQDGSIDRLRVYWLEGGGAEMRERRWSIVQDVLHWLP